MIRLRAMRERRGVDGHPGHRAAEDPDLRRAHRRVGRLEVLHDRLGRLAIDAVEEQVRADRERVVVGVLRREHLRVRHRAERSASGRRPELRGTARIAAAPRRRLGRRRVAHEPEDHELAVPCLGDERHRRAGHHVRDRRQLLGRRVGRATKPRDRLRGRRQEQHPADDLGQRRASRNLNRVTTPKLPPPPRIAQNRSGSWSRRRARARRRP